MSIYYNIFKNLWFDKGLRWNYSLSLLLVVFICKIIIIVRERLIDFLKFVSFFLICYIFFCVLDHFVNFKALIQLIIFIYNFIIPLTIMLICISFSKNYKLFIFFYFLLMFLMSSAVAFADEIHPEATLVFYGGDFLLADWKLYSQEYIDMIGHTYAVLWICPSVDNEIGGLGLYKYDYNVNGYIFICYVPWGWLNSIINEGIFFQIFIEEIFMEDGLKLLHLFVVDNDGFILKDCFINSLTGLEHNLESVKNWNNFLIEEDPFKSLEQNRINYSTSPEVRIIYLTKNPDYDEEILSHMVWEERVVQRLDEMLMRKY